MSRVTALVESLMDRSRLGAVVDIQFLKVKERFLEEAVLSEIALIDLNHPDSLQIIAELVAHGHPKIVAYGSHVERDNSQGARDAGATTVLARSQLLGHPQRWLA